MSRSTLWNVYNTKVTWDSEYPNGHGSAPPVWGYICKYVLGESETWWLHNYGKNASKLWEAYKNKNVPTAIRFALLWTFDYAVVETKHLLEAADYCEQAYNILWHPEYVNHWLSFAEHLRDVHENHDYRLVGIGLGCTSVNDPYEYINFKDMKLFSVIDVLNEVL